MGLHEPEQTWQELDARPTYGGQELIWRTNNLGQFAVLAIDREGCTELELDADTSRQAFLHPGVTPGLETYLSQTNWDEVLDKMIELDDDVVKGALRRLRRVYKGVEVSSSQLMSLLDSPK